MNSEMNMGEAMQAFLNKSNRIKKGIQAHQLTEVWETLMGKTVARYTDKLQLVNHTLFISTHVAPLRHELMYQKETILQRVNEILGADTVKEVVIR
ncbi:DUF721 domain-containing protein [Phnomibacter sp. MR]|uniref:DUF721 domain-containing protein n=1 Tax=Phnomibacter sp. MR TaxID=3042318 RepID=UPI003A7FA9E4